MHSLCMHTMYACRGQKMMSDILKLHVFVSLFFTWVLETELESSGRAVKADNLSAISPAFILHKLEWLSFYMRPHFASIHRGVVCSLGIYTQHLSFGL